MTKTQLQEIQSTLKSLDNTLGDAREAEAELPGTKNSTVLAQLKELTNGLGRASRAVTALQTLANKEQEW
jgi:hypothetical protein